MKHLDQWHSETSNSVVRVANVSAFQSLDVIIVDITMLLHM